MRTGGITLVFAWLCIAALACDDMEMYDLEPSQSIAGGAETNYDTWRGVISVLSEDVSFTTATLIHPRVVLTAGHGVVQHMGQKDFDYTGNPSAVKIIGGSDVFGSDMVPISTAMEIVTHPSWGGTFQDSNAVDLALILLKDPADDKGFYCVAESQSTEALAPQDEGLIVGYGLVDNSGEYTAGIHRWGETTILGVNSKKITIGGPTSVCPGDSGGPLFIKSERDTWEIAGVTSSFAGICVEDGLGYEVNLHDHREWIEETVAALTGDDLGECTNCGPDGFDCPPPPESGADSGADADPADDSDSDADCSCSLGVTGTSGLLQRLASILP